MRVEERARADVMGICECQATSMAKLLPSNHIAYGVGNRRLQLRQTYHANT